MNSIVLYLGHSQSYSMMPFRYVSGAMRTHWDRLVENTWAVGAWLIVAYILYRRRAFVVV
jgi:heparan-alpha-glucosaminide N-acetyltransferase